MWIIGDQLRVERVPVGPSLIPPLVLCVSTSSRHPYLLLPFQTSLTVLQGFSKDPSFRVRKGCLRMTSVPFWLGDLGVNDFPFLSLSYSS